MLHEKLHLNINQIGDVNRLIIHHWANSAAPFLLCEMQSSIENIADCCGVELLYVTLSSVITYFIQNVGISVSKVEGAYLYHTLSNAESAFPESYKKAH